MNIGNMFNTLTSSALGETVGGLLNDITGVTSSAKQQYQHQKALQSDAQNFAKWQMGNAHQMEVQDLEKAGLNPILSAGGSGASAGVSMGSASAGSASANPIEMILGAINTAKGLEKTDADIRNETAKTNSDIQKNDAEIIRIAKENGYTEQRIQNAIKERDLIIAQMNKATSEKEYTDAITKMKQWESENPLLIHLWAPMAVGVTSAIAGGLTGGITGGVMTGLNSAKQHQYRMTEKGLSLNSNGWRPEGGLTLN